MTSPIEWTWDWDVAAFVATVCSVRVHAYRDTPTAAWLVMIPGLHSIKVTSHNRDTAARAAIAAMQVIDREEAA